jgi:hypothetical protein
LTGIAGATALVMWLVPSDARAQDTIEEVPLDRTIVEACYAQTSLEVLTADCVGKAAEKCSTTPPHTENTLDIWQCAQAEMRVWDQIAATSQERLRADWRKADKSDRDRGYDLEALGIAREADFDRLILAQSSYRKAMCSLIYAANGPGSLKNIDGAQCDMEMAASWAFKLRDEDWNNYSISYRYQK